MTVPVAARRALEMAERLVPSSEVRVEIARATGRDAGQFMPDVKLVHVPTGETVTCAEYPTQIENKLHALLELRLRLDKYLRSDCD